MPSRRSFGVKTPWIIGKPKQRSWPQTWRSNSRPCLGEGLEEAQERFLQVGEVIV